jgi:hypothetical protein
MKERIGNPIDAATEKAVDDLIKMHGLDTVVRHLEMIMHNASWSEWQRVRALVTRRANKMKRDAEKSAVNESLVLD